MQLAMKVIGLENCPSSPRNDTICVVQWDTLSNTCHSDFGGPLACQENNQKWFLRGVASSRSKTCNSGSAFTKVTSFERWIRSIISRK